MGVEEQNNNYQKYYNLIFNKVHEIISDFDTLVLGTEIIKIARDRLDKDLDKEDIKEEYEKLNEIVKQLNGIINNYI